MNSKILLLFFWFFMLAAVAPEALGNEAPAVGYAEIGERPSVQMKHYLGTIEAINHVDVITRTDGFIKAIHFNEGQMIKAGELLFEIDPAVHESVLEQAAAGVSSAEAALRLAAAQNERMRTLLNSRAISRSEADVSFADYSVAEAALQQANAALHLAEIQLGFTRITAPISGRAGLARVSVGSYVHTGSGPLVDIAQLDPIRVVIPVREADFLNALSGAGDTGFDLLGKDFAPQLRLSNGQIFPERGTLDVVANNVDTMTGTVELRARFPNPQFILLPGGMVDVTLDSQTPPMQAAVPAVALQQNRNGYFVLVLDDDNRVEERPVELGQQDGPYFMVTQGLRVGERVVVDGIQRIRPGIQVTPVKREFLRD